MEEQAAADMDLGGEAGGEGGSPDVFADVPADGGVGEPTGAEAVEAGPGEGLGGEGAGLEELGEEEPLPADEAPINGGGEGGLPEGQHDPLGGEQPAPAEEPPPAEEQPPAEPGPEPEPEPEPKPESKKSKPASKKGGGKKGTTERAYTILKQVEGGTEDEPLFQVAIPGGIVAGNGEAALRKAYSELVAEDSGDAVTLAPIPAHYWNPKTVQAKVRHERAVEIA